MAGALRNLSVNDEIAEEIATAGGIDALIAASQEPRTPRTSRTPSHPSHPLAPPCATVHHRAPLRLQCTLPPVTSQEHLGNSDVQAEVAGALWGLSVNDDIEEAIATANGIKARRM